jgi:hypothetical protein
VNTRRLRDIPRCHCGRMLHYSSPTIQTMVEKIVADRGEFVLVRGPDGRRWRVQRHFIALHGVMADDLPTLGFEEITS